MKLRMMIGMLMIGIVLGKTVTAQGKYLLPGKLRQAQANIDELVSFSNSTSFKDALRILNEVSKRFSGKIIVDPFGKSDPIGVDINKLHWMNALETILRKHALWYEAGEDYFRIMPDASGLQLSKEEKEVLDTFQAREVVISAIFFEADVNKLREAGMSWRFLRGKGLNLEARHGSADTRSGLMELELEPSLDFSTISAIFKTLENKRVGEVIASPQVTVRSGKEGRIQVGSDIAISLQDFSGNTVTQFFSTGSIIKVMPDVMRKDSITFIHLKLEIERSNNTGSDSRLEIKKSSAATSVMLLDGEETVIGGLYLNEESKSREGIPFLKDLPWWLFGLRYVFGYEARSLIKKELLILIKGELLPTIEERFENKVSRRSQKVLKIGLEQMDERLKNYQQQVEERK